MSGVGWGWGSWDPKSCRPHRHSYWDPSQSSACPVIINQSLISDYRARRKWCSPSYLAGKGNPLTSPSPGGAHRGRVWTRLDLTDLKLEPQRKGGETLSTIIPEGVSYTGYVSSFQRRDCEDFPGGPVVETSPSNAEDAGSMPGQGSKISHAAG